MILLLIQYLFLQQKYSNNPQQLVRVIQNCLQTEMRITEQAENVSFLIIIYLFYQGQFKRYAENVSFGNTF